MSILPVIFGGNRSAGAIVQSMIRSRGMAQHKEKVTLSGKRCPVHGVMVSCCGCYVNGLWFDSHFADSRFFFFAFFQAPLRCHFGVSVVRLELGLG